MPRPSIEALKYGEDIRKGSPLACPECGATTRWAGVAEYADHVRSCRIIALAIAVGTVDVPPLDDMLPERKGNWLRR